MNVQLLAHTPSLSIQKAAQICRNSTDSTGALENALKAGHDSLLEHWVASFHIEGISRACSHQLVRHRMASYAQVSQRHVQVNDLDWYVTPPHSDIAEYHVVMQMLQHQYIKLIREGMPLEDARYILPNATKTDLVMTINARSLDNFFKLRCCSRAQWEIQILAKKMLAPCRFVTTLFDKDYPDCESCKEPCGDYLCQKN